MKLKFNWRESILFENNNYLLINKPPFLSTLEDRSTPHNVMGELHRHEAGLQAGHRLDKNTSGALVLVRHAAAYRHVSMQFENRKVKKVYHALTAGCHSFQEQKAEAPILKLADGTAVISGDGKSAETWFQTMEVFSNHTLVECRPTTGRMHQIRLHLALFRAPISGDVMYGGRPFLLSEVKKKFKLKKDAEETPLTQRMALHAYSIAFEDLNGDLISVSAPYPKDFRAVMNQLRRFA